MQSDSINLIADIGGTNARFALVDGPTGRPLEAETLRCADYPTLVEAVQTYLKAVGSPRPGRAAISLATAVSGDQLVMTNHGWAFSIQQTRQALGLTSLKLLNDYTALALALPHFTADEYSKIGGGQGSEGQVMAVLGPGTGLGVSALTPVGHHWAPLQGEGGHVSYGPLDEREAGVISIVRRQFEHVSAECLVSGSGLSLLYQSLAELDGVQIPSASPKEITTMAIQKSSSLADEAVSMFCAILGTVAGNLALTTGARSGVFIGGGIVPQLGEYFAQSPFRKRFEKHGRFTRYLEEIPTYVIQSRYPALRGAAIALGSDYDNLGVTSIEAETGMASNK